MTGPIAIVGMACEFPGARSPRELWEDTLAQRRAFRRLPTERLRLEDYYSSDRDAPDRTYAIEAAVIEGYEFDRVGFRVAASTYPIGRSSPLAGARRRRQGPPRRRIRTRRGVASRSDRGLPRQHAHRRVLESGRDAAALALRRQDARRGIATRRLGL